MKKALVIVIAFVLLSSLVFTVYVKALGVSASTSVEIKINESASDDHDDDSNEVNRTVNKTHRISEDEKETVKEARERMKEDMKEDMEEMMEDNETMKEHIRDFREKMRMHNGTIDVEGRNITIKELSNETKEIIAGKINAKTGLNLTSDDINGTLGATLSAYLSNGRKAYIRYLPDRASLVALDRLRAKCDNCTVELKEITVGNKTRAVYVVQTEKESRVLLIFGKKKVVSAEVDAETGEVISVKKPWWSFLSKDKDEIETDIEDNASLTVSG